MGRAISSVTSWIRKVFGPPVRPTDQSYATKSPPLDIEGEPSWPTPSPAVSPRCIKSATRFIGDHSIRGSRAIRRIEAAVRRRFLITRNTVIPRTTIEPVAYPSSEIGIKIKLTVPGSWQISATVATVASDTSPNLMDHRSILVTPFSEITKPLYPPLFGRTLVTVEIRDFEKLRNLRFFPNTTSARMIFDCPIWWRRNFAEGAAAKQ
jgi:hypothetical protein